MKFAQLEKLVYCFKANGAFMTRIYLLWIQEEAMPGNGQLGRQERGSGPHDHDLKLP